MKGSWLPISLRETLQCAYSPRPLTSCRQQALNIRPRQFTTASRKQAIAAPEINFRDRRDRDPGRGGWEREREIGYQGGGEEQSAFVARLLPVSPSYFTAQPLFTDDFLVLQNLMTKHSGLPCVKPGEHPRVAWRSLSEYRDRVGETVKAAKYHKIVEILVRLNKIHPSVRPEEVQTALDQYKRNIDPFKNEQKTAQVDSLGRTLGAGRRKSATARAWLVEGTGEVLVNGKSLADAFGRVHDRESVIWALKATNRIDKYNVWALSMGGGTTGQAEALTLAVGKALMAHEPALKPALRRAGCLTRDPKRVERKKPGHVKARKMPAWVKR
ncbi:hypothetical protein HYALB_00006335 [Hymenoscyphus albidus]|uniref:Small ribosomal subunit protein uS9m n=1 Tax=Hymenoscyphus albidus TaxID=595503 RepID=A0A9N9LEC2_9HELO|nr:hypothetical protein HYALB_00006335 [Hymenoscyphus albidus]